METNAFHRHQLINSLMAQKADKVVENAINLWDQLAVQLIVIVGDGGFDALYLRSVLLTQATFPWLAADSPMPQTDHRFTALKLNLEEQKPDQASEANCLLLITFTDILASLIGEELTSSILRSAWGNRAGMEFNND